MRIAVISTPIFQLYRGFGLRAYGGLEQIAWECARGLALRGHEVLLMAPDGSECPGVEVVQCGPAGMVGEEHAYGGFPDLKDQQGKVVRPKYEGYWKKLPDCDAVIDHGWQKHSYLLKQEGVLKAPVLGVMHAPIATMYRTLPPIEKPCMVCISEDQAKSFREQHYRDCRVAYNGINTQFHQPMDVPRSDRYLFLARFSSIKGCALSIEACKAAGVGLDLVGDTAITQEPDYLRKCLAMADGSQIRFVGPCTRAETVYWFSQAHALLHPVRDFQEPLGLAPLEAQACGCPVISWRNGAMPETVQQDRTGFLVTSLNEMISHIKNDSVSRLDRKQCQEWASGWSVEKMSVRYEQLCSEAIEGGW